MTYEASSKHVHQLQQLHRLIQLAIQLLLQLLLQLCIHLLLHKMQKLLGFTLLAEDYDLVGSLLAKMSALIKELSVPEPPSGSDANMSEADCSQAVQTVQAVQTAQTAHRQMKAVMM